MSRVDPLTRIVAAVVIGAAFMSAVPDAHASDRTSFYAIEHEAGEDRAFDEEEALVARISAPGAAVASAREALEAAGATHVGTSRNGRLEFLYARGEVAVFIWLTQAEGVVRAVQVSRQTLGG